MWVAVLCVLWLSLPYLCCRHLLHCFLVFLFKSRARGLKDPDGAARRAKRAQEASEAQEKMARGGGGASGSGGTGMSVSSYVESGVLP